MVDAFELMMLFVPECSAAPALSPLFSTGVDVEFPAVTESPVFPEANPAIVPLDLRRRCDSALLAIIDRVVAGSEVSPEEFTTIILILPDGSLRTKTSPSVGTILLLQRMQMSRRG